MRGREDYLISGRPFTALLSFSLPMMTGNLFQQFYTMADSVIAGRFIGEGALAAIGASYALTSVFIAVAIGGGNGASVITSNAFGAGLWDKMKDSIRTSIISFLVLSLILAAAGYIAAPLMMSLLRTPEDIIGIALVPVLPQGALDPEPSLPVQLPERASPSEGHGVPRHEDEVAAVPLEHRRIRVDAPSLEPAEAYQRHAAGVSRRAKDPLPRIDRQKVVLVPVEPAEVLFVHGITTISVSYDKYV